MVKAADIAGIASSRIAAVAAVLLGVLVQSGCSTSGSASGASFVEGALPPGRKAAAVVASAQPAIDPIATGSIGAPGVFNSVAIRIRNFPVTAHWQQLSREIEACAAGFCGDDDGLFERITSETEGRDLVDKARIVNAAVNAAILYRSDRTLYGVTDHWATPQETLSRGSGDCEDLAILKMTALLRAGVPARSMSLVVLRDRRRGVYHAVLAVATGSGSLILDNTRSDVVMDADLPDYQPLFSLGVAQSWIHGTRAAGPPALAQDASLSAIAPGEGAL